MPRKVVQVCVSSTRFFALCDDGTIWDYDDDPACYRNPWSQVKPVPGSESDLDIDNLPELKDQKS